ncbi:hypothetical protein HYFRA_00002948 [Hymenoscyphus fraxineus]|uniref:Uncharacterized protein n=1 Tax=Hymenoscyphus fraxineus TaxID=746836 RepID=A0A9N9PQR3_9HELO|nr:hypothetical protein HYFRA_00002948 [Hymenoscyphus fraxineus]
MSSGGIFPHTHPVAEEAPKRKRFSNRCKYLTITSIAVVGGVVVGVALWAHANRNMPHPIEKRVRDEFSWTRWMAISIESLGPDEVEMLLLFLTQLFVNFIPSKGSKSSPVSSYEEIRSLGIGS